MNRSILIVICDFLLVSLLVFSTPNLGSVTKESNAGPKPALATNAVSSGTDLAAAMRQALNQEQQSRGRLQTQLTQLQGALTAREQQARTLRQELQSKQQNAQQLQQAQAGLERQLTAAQSNIQTLNQRLQSSASETALTKEELAKLRAQAAQNAKALEQQLAELSRSNQMALAQKEQLAGQLQLAQVKQQAAAQQIALMSDQVKAEREQNARLSEGVQTLAARSGQLAKVIQENQPLAPNTIFDQFVSNSVEATFQAVRPGLFGDATRTRDTKTVLVTDGKNIFALCHVQDTPLSLWTPGTDWNSLAGTLSHGAAKVAVRSLSFCWTDPRIVWMPVSAEEARQLGAKIYPLSADPFKFQDAVLIGAQQGYYGECRFQIDLSTPGYVKLDRSFLKGLFGQFNPSRGDLVFSRTGQLLGIMANDSYCLMIRKFDAGATVRFGGDVTAQHTGPLLSQLYSQVTQMPLKLQ